MGVCNYLVVILSLHNLGKLFFTLFYPFVTNTIELWKFSSSAKMEKLDPKIDISVNLIDNERVLAVNYQRLKTVHLATLCHLFNIVKVFKYYHWNMS